MLFPQRLDFTDSKATAALGSSYTFDITREFHIDTIIIHLSLNVGTVAATMNADSLQNVLKRVTMTVADGARTRNVVDMSGPALLEYWAHVNGQLDFTTATAVNTNTTGIKNLYYPIPFVLPNVDDPFGSVLLLPAPRFTSNPQLQLTFASVTDIDVNVTPTFVVSGNIVARCIVIRRSVLVRDWLTYDAELLESTVAYTTSASNQGYELQSPGSYTGILLRCYLSSAAHGDISIANGEFKLQLLGTNLRRFRLTDEEVINYYSKIPNVGAVSIFPGSYFMDFLSDKMGNSAGEFGSVLDANLPVTTGARLRLLQDINGAAGVQVKYVTHRIFGVLDKLKMLSRLGSKPKG